MNFIFKDLKKIYLTVGFLGIFSGQALAQEKNESISQSGIEYIVSFVESRGSGLKQDSSISMNSALSPDDTEDAKKRMIDRLRAEKERKNGTVVERFESLVTSTNQMLHVKASELETFEKYIRDPYYFRFTTEDPVELRYQLEKLRKRIKDIDPSAFLKIEVIYDKSFYPSRAYVEINVESKISNLKESSDHSVAGALDRLGPRIFELERRLALQEVRPDFESGWSHKLDSAVNATSATKQR